MENNPKVFNNTIIQIPKHWANETKGIRKELLYHRCVSFDKPTELSECCVKISNVENLDNYESNYLKGIGNEEQTITIYMGNAITPVDIYIELLLNEMYLNEKSRAFIRTKNNTEISFTIELNTLSATRYYYELEYPEIYQLSIKYKEIGVKLYKTHPLFAQNHFNKAAKILISLSNVHEMRNEIAKLLHSLYLNIAQCLLNQNRYDEVIHVLRYTTTIDDDDNDEGDSCSTPDIKAIYRKSLAYYHLKHYDLAKCELKRINYEEFPELQGIWNNIASNEKTDNQNYSTMVKKMFG